METRKNFCYILAGTNGTGKSSFLIQILKQLANNFSKRAELQNFVRCRLPELK